MITFKQKGDFKKLNSFLERSKNALQLGELDKYAMRVVEALRNSTPIDSGETAKSWGYRIERRKDRVSIVFTNDNIQNGVPIAVILQYGHGTGWGGYVEGRDYINPAVRPIFDDMAEYAWKEVSKT